MTMTAKESAIITANIVALAAATCATPGLIIDRLTGVLWTAAEADTLRRCAALFKPLETAIVDELIDTARAAIVQ